MHMHIETIIKKLIIGRTNKITHFSGLLLSFFFFPTLQGPLNFLVNICNFSVKVVNILWGNSWSSLSIPNMIDNNFILYIEDKNDWGTKLFFFCVCVCVCGLKKSILNHLPDWKLYKVNFSLSTIFLMTCLPAPDYSTTGWTSYVNSKKSCKYMQHRERNIKTLPWEKKKVFLLW